MLGIKTMVYRYFVNLKKLQTSLLNSLENPGTFVSFNIVFKKNIYNRNKPHKKLKSFHDNILPRPLFLPTSDRLHQPVVVFSKLHTEHFQLSTFNFQLATFNILESIEKASTDALLLRSSTLELGLVKEGSWVLAPELDSLRVWKVWKTIWIDFIKSKHDF